MRFTITLKRIKERFKRLPFIAWIYRVCYPGYGTCEHCGLPWRVCETKDISVDDNWGVFYVCSHCWEHCSWRKIYEASARGYASQWQEAFRGGFGDHFVQTHKFNDIMDAIEREYKKTHNTNN